MGSATDIFNSWHSKISKLRISLKKKDKKSSSSKPEVNARSRRRSRISPSLAIYEASSLDHEMARWSGCAGFGGGGGSTEPPLSRQKESIDRESELEIDRRRVIPLLFAFRCLLINSAIE